LHSAIPATKAQFDGPNISTETSYRFDERGGRLGTRYEEYLPTMKRLVAAVHPFLWANLIRDIEDAVVSSRRFTRARAISTPKVLQIVISGENLGSLGRTAKWYLGREIGS
jgi:hypothetical protein